MTRFKKLRRIEVAIEQNNVPELQWALGYCLVRQKTALNKKAKETWRKRSEQIETALEAAKTA